MKEEEFGLFLDQLKDEDGLDQLEDEDGLLDQLEDEDGLEAPGVSSDEDELETTFANDQMTDMVVFDRQAELKIHFVSVCLF